MEAQARDLDQADAVRTIDLLAAAIAQVKEGSDPRTQLEVALLKASRPGTDASTEALLTRIERLERGIGSAPARRAARHARPDPAARRGRGRAHGRSGTGRRRRR